MKIWHLPPRYMDDVTLEAEQHTLLSLFDHIAKQTPSSSFPENDRLFMKYCNHHKYILFRLILVNNELVKRELAEPIDFDVYYDDIVTEKDYDIDEEDIKRDITIIQEIWSEFVNSEIGDYIGDLSLADTEQLLQEIEFLLSVVENEYDSD